jgi:Zn-dependent protease with chaperone function
MIPDASVQTPAAVRDIYVEPWPTERPLFALALIVSLGLWLLAIISIFGILYALILGIFFFLAHVGFIAHVRGSGVRLGPEQFPELHAAVQRLSDRIGLPKPPEAYLLHGGGMLNALATRFIGSDVIVLYSELIEACGENTSARDMIIAHELGHVHRGHVRWAMMTAPAMLVPFLGMGLSRAREYTCDRYGAAGAGDRDGALLGLSILAAGGPLGRRVNRQHLVSQRADLNTGWMTIGEWLSTHPPVAKRMAQLDPSLAVVPVNSAQGAVRAVAIIGACVAPFVVTGSVAALVFPLWLARVSQTARGGDSPLDDYKPPAPAVAAESATRDVAALGAFVEAELRAGRDLPWDSVDLYNRWNAAHPNTDEPVDPYDGERYGYNQRGSQFRVYSVGPDLAYRTADDVVYESRRAAQDAKVER